MIRVIKGFALLAVIVLFSGFQGAPLLPKAHATLSGGVAGGSNKGAVSAESLSAPAEQQTANLPPVASFTQSASIVDPGVPVSFDASSSYDPDGVVVSYTWDFGDRTVAIVTEPRISHTYSPQCPASFTVTLRVTDNGGAISPPVTSTITLDVVILPYSIVLTSPPPFFRANVGEVVTFTAEVNICAFTLPLDYLWDFGDGTGAATLGTSSSIDVQTHVYTGPGPVTVRVTVDDALVEAMGLILSMTSTSVSCTPSLAIVNQPTTCTATVTDTSPGTPITPTGSVSFVSSGPGTFSASSCTLAGTGASASCSVSYTPTAFGSVTITATCPGDSNHLGSSGSVALIIRMVVDIDIKPGSDPNSINVKSMGVVPVAILTTSTFDASTVDPSTVRFGRTGAEAAPVQSDLNDVDQDGDLDLILHFNTQDTGFKAGDTNGFLTGRTHDRTPIEGADSVRVFFPGDVNGDFIVNVLDLVLVGRSFGSGPESPNWTIYADFNEDSAINILDLVVVGSYFGQHA